MAGYCQIRVRNICVCIKTHNVSAYIFYLLTYSFILLSDDSTCLKSHYLPTEFKVHGQIVFNMNVSPQFKRAQS